MKSHFWNETTTEKNSVKKLPITSFELKRETSALFKCTCQGLQKRMYVLINKGAISLIY